MGVIELPQPGEGLFQRSPHPSERNSLLLGDLIVENVDGSMMEAKIAGQRLCIAAHGSHPQRCALLQRLLAVVRRLSIGLQVRGCALSRTTQSPPEQCAVRGTVLQNSG